MKIDPLIIVLIISGIYVIAKVTKKLAKIIISVAVTLTTIVKLLGPTTLSNIIETFLK